MLPQASRAGKNDHRRRRLIQRFLNLCCSDTFLLTLFTGSFANERSGYENLPKSEYGSLLKGCRRQENWNLLHRV